MALVTETVDFGATLKQMMSRVRRKTRSVVCSVVNGGHELYRARTDTRLYQQCLLCGHETPGWTIDRRGQSAIASRQLRVESAVSAVSLSAVAVTSTDWSQFTVWAQIGLRTQTELPTVDLNS